MFKKTVDSVIAQFRKTIADLEEVENLHLKRRVDHLEQQQSHIEAARFHDAEVQRARQIRSKLNDLIA